MSDVAGSSREQGWETESTEAVTDLKVQRKIRAIGPAVG